MARWRLDRLEEHRSTFKTGYHHEGVDKDCGREGDQSGGGAMVLRLRFCVR
jgi:hypothetical protein